ncbi:oligopeptide ABC transporter substrate-binding protein [Spiroplasma helicoides]|uniref:Oligopeptide ABC transporter substrate-binding protein n=1 Tax=Spiroplasma helicoides TaxID=216938 RepID=A0A1B3SLX8_9MOLU|nr:ABC transporter substrate-binding protein [Spiroplasma helicoides]AOG60917.1 oligopeptide ABC transporter substrate-binding protein [Spiroplasma helicoides]
MKKLIGWLMATSVVAPSVFSVVSCGSLDKDPENTITMTQRSYPSYWVTAKTIDLADLGILADTNATPLSVDEYGRVFGDLFLMSNPNYSASNPYVGEHNDNFDTWTYKLRDDASWSDYKGNKVDDLKSEDFVNTARYVLNPMNASTIVSVWKSFIQGAAELNAEAIAKSKDADYDFDKIFDKYYKNTDESSRLGIKVNGSQVQFKLVKPANYFETLLTFGTFAPIHANALVDPSVDVDYTKGYYSGQFVPTSFVKDSVLILDKNQNYYYKDKSNINRIKELLSSGGASRSRELYDAGTANEVNIDPNDATGWSKYVGDAANPLDTPGLVKYTTSRDDSASWMLFFNYLNSDYQSTDAAKKSRATAASRLLQYASVRRFIQAGFDRTKWATYYSSPYDVDKSVSSQLRNTFVPQNFLSYEGRDYLGYVADAINKSSAKPTKAVTVDDLKDGVDYLRNSVFGSAKEGSPEFNSKVGEMIKGINDIIQKDKFLNHNKGSDGKIHLVSAEDPTATTTQGKYRSEMIEDFNAIQNNPIKIDLVRPNDYNGYSEIYNTGGSDLMFSSWSPGYEDPMTYSNSLKLDGEYSLYFRLDQLFGFESYEKLSQNGKATAKDAFDSLKKANSSKYDELIVQDEKGISPLFESRYNYSVSVNDIDKSIGVDIDKRYSSFAKQEVQTLYEDAFVVPFMRRSPTATFTISHMKPFALPRVTYGLSSYKYINVNYDTELLSKDQIEELRAKYLKALDEIKKDPTSNRDADFWK